ncbi:hypothetical protein [uncultured Nostoc sp.]|uniref:hypothetical protein n=1 Tax=uncultured Nostoc sp. TaxID=340711 RepID=UPI0035CAB8BE
MLFLLCVLCVSGVRSFLNLVHLYTKLVLGKILQDNQHHIAVVKALSGYWSLDDKYYNLAWKCAQNIHYQDFYKAWHQHNFVTRAMQSLKKILFTRII